MRMFVYAHENSDGVTYVIDPGYVKQKQYDPRSGIESLAVVPISRVAATQRAGRAGRTRPGLCYRLYTKEMHDFELIEESVPEIQRTNLANTVLMLKSMGIVDPLAFEFLDNPSADAIVEALLSLFYLAAIDADGRITKLGKAMADFPLDPSLSKLLITSVALKCREEILTITAMVSLLPIISLLVSL
jgi:ATP-dependent RNA helicase DHX8/PRP22